jgi:hypothetical protein
VLAPLPQPRERSLWTKDRSPERGKITTATDDAGEAAS